MSAPAAGLLLATCLLTPGLVAAQGLAVLVLDEQSRPIEGAQGQVSELLATTGADGMMYFRGLPPGLWELTTRFVGFLPDVRDVTVLGREPTRVLVKLVPAPLRLPPVVVEATRPGLFGIVSTTRLEPIAGAEVHLLGRGGRAVPTDSTGHFMHPEATGEYLIRVTAEGYRERRFSLSVPPDGGRELLVHLDAAAPGYVASGNRELYYLRDLSFRLAWARPNSVQNRAQLAPYGTRSVCEVPEVGAVVNRRHLRGLVTLIDGQWMVPNLCGIRADAVEIVEWGRDVCAGSASGLADLFRGICSPTTQASGRAGAVRSRIRQGPAYLIIWLSK
ncbi:MAG: carboxypeptidase regulatory-like domain-containing protein [Gemmatimonadales bacterium]